MRLDGDGRWDRGSASGVGLPAGGCLARDKGEVALLLMVPTHASKLASHGDKTSPSHHVVLSPPLKHVSRRSFTGTLFFPRSPRQIPVPRRGPLRQCRDIRLPQSKSIPDPPANPGGCSAPATQILWPCSSSSRAHQACICALSFLAFLAHARSDAHFRSGEKGTVSDHFNVRPSLTLGHVGQIRKGTPGARLPHEPWDMDLSAEFDFPTRNAPPTSPDNQSPCPPTQPETTPQADPVSLQTTGNSGTCLASREIAAMSLPDETSSSRSLSADDADMDSLPSLSYTTSEPSSSALSRSSSSACLQGPMDVISSSDSHDQPPASVHVDNDIIQDDDPLSYHSDFDYYTRSFSDPSDSESDEPTPGGKHSPDVGITPYSSVYDPIVDFEPGSSTDTMRRVSVPRERTQTTHVIGSPILELPQDGDRRRGQPSQPERQRAREDEDRGREASRHNGGHSSAQFSGAYGGGAAGDDNNGNKARPGKLRSPASSTPDYTSSSDDDVDGLTVYYSLDGMSNGPASCAHSRTHSKTGGGSDDDVPLAQRVPTALSAQKSIRKQLRDERQQRKLERAKSSRRAAEPPLPFHPTEHLRAPAAPSRFRKRSVSAAPAPVSGPRTAPIEPFPAEDLTRKLMNIQTSSRTPPATAPLTYDGSVPTNPRVPGHSGGVSRSPSRGKYADQITYLQQKTPRVPETSSQDRPLRSTRSFHRSDGRHSETQRPPINQTSVPRLGRSATAAAHTRRDAPSAGHEQHPKSGRVSEDGRKPSATLPRPSMDKESDVAQRAVQRPPVPPLPISDSTPPQHMSRVSIVQQRIFIGDMQRFNMVEITPATNAGDVIATVARQGKLDRPESWMVFEMAQDYGMGRSRICSSRGN